LIAGVAVSNLAEGMDICLLCLLCRYRPFRRADHSFRGVIPRVCVCVCLIACGPETLTTTA